MQQALAEPLLFPWTGEHLKVEMMYPEDTEELSYCCAVDECLLCAHQCVTGLGSTQQYLLSSVVIMASCLFYSLESLKVTYK